MGFNIMEELNRIEQKEASEGKSRLKSKEIGEENLEKAKI